MTKNKTNRLAVVTGAAQGIGQAYAIRLAEDGADVVVIDMLDCSITQNAIEKLARKFAGYNVTSPPTAMWDPRPMPSFVTRAVETFW